MQQSGIDPDHQRGIGNDLRRRIERLTVEDTASWNRGGEPLAPQPLAL